MVEREEVVRKGVGEGSGERHKEGKTTNGAGWKGRVR